MLEDISQSNSYADAEQNMSYQCGSKVFQVDAQRSLDRTSTWNDLSAL